MVIVDESFSVGEKSNVRRMNVNDTEELRRLFAIERDPGEVEFMEGLQSDEVDLKIFATGNAEKLPIGISGKAGFVNNAEIGKLQGWIYFYPDEEERLERLKMAGVGAQLLQDRIACEISYAKFPNAVKGQMSSGLRQAIKILTRECFGHSAKMVIVAYTDRINHDSKRLLVATEFNKMGEIQYHMNDGVKKDEVWMLPIG